MQDNNYKLIFIPQLGVNDQTIKIVKWYVNNEKHIKIGDLICSVESTKTAYEVESEFEGIICLFHNEDEEVDIGEPIAVVFKDKNIYDKLNIEISKKYKKSEEQSQTITQKALKKAQELGIDVNLISKKGIIKEKDILNFHNSQNIVEIDLTSVKIVKDKINVAIYGSGKGAYTIFEVLSLDKNYSVLCYLDDFLSNQGFNNNIPVISSEYFFKNFKDINRIKIACEISNSAFRLKLRDRLAKMNIDFLNVIQPDSYIAPSVKIGIGNYIKSGAIIETNTVMGDCCIIDNGVIIAHDNKIGDGCHLAPGVTLGSSIEIGNKSVIGIGASIATGIKIGRNVIVGVGSSVVSNIPDDSIVEGVPGKIIGKHK